MKKIICRTVSVTICVILCLFALISCTGVKKEEVPSSAKYEFSGVENVEILSGDAFNDDLDMLIDIINRQHYIHYFSEANLATTGQLDVVMAVTTISCESGKITITTYEGTGSASFMNGSSVYSTYEENVDDFGSYSGKDVTILESMNIDENGYKLTYKGAYVSEDKFIVNMESSDSSGNSYTYDLVFTKA